MPWGIEKEHRIDLKKARKILDARNHGDGLSDVKGRIIEFLAVGAYKNAISGAIMLLVVGPRLVSVLKPRFGRSIANSPGPSFSSALVLVACVINRNQRPPPHL